MKILVSGGAGFIGSHIVDGYIQAGHQVVVVDDLSSGKKDHLNPGAIFVQTDITDRPAVDKIFNEHSPFDLVNHHAAQKSVTHSVAEPLKDAHINIIGGLNLLEAMRQHKVKKIIFASTGGALYGDGIPVPTPEDTPIAPASPYGIAKYALENYLRFYEKTIGIKAAILRYANVYGPRQDPHGEAGVIAIFCQKILADEPLVIFGDGEQTRDFIYVEDIVSANLAASLPNITGIWNIGAGREISINKLAQLLITHNQTNCLQPPTIYPIAREAARLGELRRSALDATKAQKELSWQSKTGLADGLKKTMDDFRDIKQT